MQDFRAYLIDTTGDIVRASFTQCALTNWMPAR